MISYSHDMTLFIASVVVSFVAAFTGLALTNDISRLPEARRKALIVMSAFILGGGIWSMHFVAMLALEVDQPVHYDLLQTLGSALVAILVAGLSLLMLHFSNRTPYLLTLAGLILGLGIVAMHFIGMHGIRGITPVFSKSMIGLTIIVAILTGIAAIWAAYGHRSRQNIIAGAVVFGSAVVAVHFTAMHGTRFSSGPPPDSQSVFIGDGTLAVTVTIAVFIICGTFLLAATTFISPRTDGKHNPNDALALSPNPVIHERTGNASHKFSQAPLSSTNGANASTINIGSVTAAASGAESTAKERSAEERSVRPSTGSPSTGSPSTGSPSTGSASTGTKNDGQKEQPIANPPVKPATLADHEHGTTDPATNAAGVASVRIPFEKNKKINFVASAKVGAIRADGRYTHLYTKSGTLFCPWSITDAEKRLADARFFRTHRSYLINLEQLSGFEKSRDSGVCHFDHLQQLNNVPVSRKRIPDLIAVLGI